MKHDRSAGALALALAAALAGLACDHGSAPPPPGPSPERCEGIEGLAGRWRLDGAAADTTAPDCAAGNDARLRNGAGFVAAGTPCAGNALGLDGAGDYAEAPDDSSLRFTASQSFTVSAWVYPLEIATHWGAIIAKSRDAGAWYGLWLASSHFEGRFVFGGVGSEDILGTPATPAAWSLVTGVQDGAADTRTLYVNGVPVATGQALDGDGPGTLRLGESPAVPGEDAEPMSGMIADARIYSRALAPSEVETLYREGCGAP